MATYQVNVCDGCGREERADFGSGYAPHVAAWVTLYEPAVPDASSEQTNVPQAAYAMTPLMACSWTCVGTVAQKKAHATVGG